MNSSFKIRVFTAKYTKKGIPALLLIFVALWSHADAVFIKEHYTKEEYQIPMRDGVKLFTIVYTPREQGKKYPIMFNRTPYSVAPYGKDQYKNRLGPSELFEKEAFIFVYQDVRGRYLSEGTFEDMRPIVPHRKNQTDESTDAWDTIDWLLKNLKNHNGKVGMWGISYGGFYAAAALVDAHAALVCSSPQAPIADWYRHDDFHRNGALMLSHLFNFIQSFGKVRPEPTTEHAKGLGLKEQDGYRFFLELGPLNNVNEHYFKHKIPFWDSVMQHPDEDTFWENRNLAKHIRPCKQAVLMVAGLFDFEDYYGPLTLFNQLKSNQNQHLVIGPWHHGGWAWGKGDRFNCIEFGSNTAEQYRKDIEFPFFMFHLKQSPDPLLNKALVFNTGSRKWDSLDTWPKNNEMKTYFLTAKGKLTEQPVNDTKEAAVFISNPSKPVPFTAQQSMNIRPGFMAEDQRFAWQRPDVLSYETSTLSVPVNISGSPEIELVVKSSTTDCDWVVKLIDVFPDTLSGNENQQGCPVNGGFQQLLRAEIMRSRYRKSFSRAEAMVPGKMDTIRLKLLHIQHMVLPGHKIMVQVQGSWFPLINLNPNQFINIYEAGEKDFIPSEQSVFGNSRLRIPINTIK